MLVHFQMNIHANFRRCTPGRETFPSLAFTLTIDIDSKQPVIVTQRELANHPPFGLVSRVQVTIT